MDSKFFCSLFEGDCPNGVKLGMGLTGGEFWPQPAGCMTAYRGQDGSLEYDTIHAVMNVDAEQVTISNQALPPLTIWQYIRRRVSGCGLESADSPPVICRIDEFGDLILDMPNVPDPVLSVAIAGGKAQLSWRYNPYEEEVSPTHFNIYHAELGSSFDWDNPTDVVVFDLGLAGLFTWESESLEHGKTYLFTVRAEHTDYAETINTNVVSVKVDTVGPPALTDLRAAWEEY